jgi:hypothetical protein
LKATLPEDLDDVREALSSKILDADHILLGTLDELTDVTNLS